MTRGSLTRAARALGPLALLALAFLPLGGCSSLGDLELLNPGGDIGAQEKNLILIALGLMLLVVIPVILLTLFFAWRYRASNTKATYAPKWAHSTAIEVVVWTIPCLIVATLAVLIWRTTHSLDPYKPLESNAAPVHVEVVALNWKWLFIYPDYGVASVNHLELPTNRPVDFKITAESMMNSFFIPQLGSQIYAMAGMQTQLHLIADKPGTYAGLSASFSGPGFSDMHFAAVAAEPKDFDAWVQEAKGSRLTLDQDTYEALEKPSSKVPVTIYSSVIPGLFDSVVDKYMPAMAMPHTASNDQAMNDQAMNGQAMNSAAVRQTTAKAEEQ
ncbi:ubiquinol oxidase subunit 2 [Aliidongia dinghuensis]|uniref:Ubiquinol oxidase subunit 2 n=1 Tax=Aliidongia dinghuensis TaxID=1867774 RepID=A0A8J2YQL8_9PROT|nr:ubiquinol oxidase subunit II [Aliidongia dinghuensis]GGF05454.1 ubiquinol oxidase subunit 2 [Aliidongia dinghuensis]